MLNGTFRGQALGCGTDVWKLSEEVRAGAAGGQLPEVGVVDDPKPGPLQHHGHREHDGPGRRGPRRDDSGNRRHAGPRQPAARGGARTGVFAVEMVGRIADHAGDHRESFHNAIVALAAIGGSTNAVVHLLAIAGRLGIELSLDDFDRIGADVPLLVNLQPAGAYLMEDLFRAGGLLAVLVRSRTGSIRPRSR